LLVGFGTKSLYFDRMNRIYKERENNNRLRASFDGGLLNYLVNLVHPV
jgi:hypothetical protein